MLGALAGDIAGSRFEGRSSDGRDFELFHSRCHFTDDSVCTIAVAKALLDGSGDFASHIRAFARRYPHAGYGKMFKAWFMADDAPAYGSWANGAPMRVSPVGWLATTMEDVDRFAVAQSSVTHNHPDAIAASRTIARAIFMARHGDTADQIRSAIERDFGYDLSLAAIRERRRFDLSARGTAQTALAFALSSDSWEDAVRACIVQGGDSDTLACIAGSVAEALHGLPEAIVRETENRLYPPLLDVVRSFRHRLKTPENEQVH